MHLCDRRRRQRDHVEAGEHRLEGLAEVLLDHPPHVLERLGRHLVPQQLELVDELLGEQTLAAGDDLTELDVRGAETLERLAQAPRDPGPRRRGAALADVPEPQRQADR